MEDLNDKVTGDLLEAPEWNQVPSELQGVIEGAGIALSAADLNQLGKAVAAYAAGGDFYTDSGIADAYVLSVVGVKQAPPAYFNGMRIRFVAGNANTGAATVNVAALGAQSLKDANGAALDAGYLAAGASYAFWYDGAGFIDFDRLRADLSSTTVDDTEGGFNLVNVPPVTGETGVQNHAFARNTSLRFIPSSLYKSMRDGTNTTDLSTYLNNASISLGSYGEFTFIPGYTYLINSPVLFNMAGLTVEAHGAKFTSTTDKQMFNLNSGFDGTDASTIEATLLRDISWLGGAFLNSAVTATASAAITIYGLRNFTFEPESVQGFWRGLITAARDSWHIRGGRWFDNSMCIEIVGTYASFTNNLEIFIRDCQFNIGITRTFEGFCKFDGDYEDVKITGGSMNVSNIGGAVSLIEFDNVGATTTHNAIEVSGVHFENGGTNTKCLKFTATQALESRSYRSININNNNFNFNGTGVIAIDGDYMIDVDVRTNRFAQTTANSALPFNIGANCQRVRFGQNSYADAYPSVGTARSEVTFEPEFRRIDTVVIAGASFSSGNQTLDMSALLSAFPSEGIPRGYWVSLQAHDSASATAFCRVRVMTSVADAGTNYEKLLLLQSYPNDTKQGASFYVDADANGDIYIDYVATGVSTLDIWMLVDAAVM